MIPLTRTGTHGLAFAIVGAALIGASISRPVPTQAADPELTTAASDSAAPASATPDATLNLVALPASTPTTAAGAQDADQVQATVKFDPRMGMPQWLRATRDLPLWSSGDASASVTGT